MKRIIEIEAVPDQEPEDSEAEVNTEEVTLTDLLQPAILHQRVATDRLYAQLEFRVPKVLLGGLNQSTSFDVALTYLKRGVRMTRQGWNGKDMFVFWQPGYPSPGIPINANTARATGLPEGTLGVFQPYLMIYDGKGAFSPWVPSQQDLQADDWVCASFEAGRTFPDLPKFQCDFNLFESGEVPPYVNSRMSVYSLPKKKALDGEAKNALEGLLEEFLAFLQLEQKPYAALAGYEYQMKFDPTRRNTGETVEVQFTLSVPAGLLGEPQEAANG